MKVLITGASGFIGSHAVRSFAARGHDLRCLMRSGRAEVGEAVFGDLTDPASLVRAVDGVDAVIHLASLLKVPWKREFETVNVGGTSALMEAIAARSTPPVTVIVSSLAAAGPRDRPRTESDEPHPISRYERVKLATERAALAHAARVPVTIVRPPMVFGEGDRYGLDLFRSNARGLHLVPSLAEHRLSLVHGTDLAAALIGAVEKGERADGSIERGVYYVADAAMPTYADLGRMVAQACGRETRVLRVPSPITGLVALGSELVARVRDRPTILNLDKWREAKAGSWTCDAAKARAQLGFAPELLEQRLRQTVEWYRAMKWL